MKFHFYPRLSALHFKKLAILLIAVAGFYSSRACYADFTYVNGCVGDTVFFHALDGSAAYSWDYGDTASGADNVSHDVNGYHVYNAPGDYYVTLFVNIGAEWDYRTNVIHIGNSCFHADFQTQCYTNLSVNFTDYSTGNHSSQFWDFGDPGSGTNDTTSAQSSYHLFSAEGTYQVTYIINNGTQSDTIVKSVVVDSICLSAYVGNFTAALNCVNDTVTIYANFSNDVTFIGWDFGDPGSGLANYSNDQNPVHQYSTPGLYIVTLVYGNAQHHDTIYKALPVMDCSVWPGDVNADGEVNAEDIFGLGIFYGDTGVQRQSASQNWNGQQCNSWSRQNFAWMYLQDLVDKKMADCNGDGIINAADVQAIQANYGKRHNAHNNRSAILYHALMDPTLSATVSANSVVAGNDIVVNLALGSSNMPMQSIYGCSFTLLFDPSKVDANALVNLSLAWFDTTGNSLLTFYHEDYANGRLEISFVKTNHQSFTGFGNIGTVTFHTKNTVWGNFDVVIDGTAKIFSTNQWGGNGGNQEVVKPLYLQGSSANILNPLSVDKNDNSGITIFPNPSKGVVYIKHAASDYNAQVQVINNLGEVVAVSTLTSAEKTEAVSLDGLPAGLYLVNVKNATGSPVQSARIFLVN